MPAYRLCDCIWTLWITELPDWTGFLWQIGIIAYQWKLLDVFFETAERASPKVHCDVCKVTFMRLSPWLIKWHVTKTDSQDCIVKDESALLMRPDTFNDLPVAGFLVWLHNINPPLPVLGLYFAGGSSLLQKAHPYFNGYFV